MFLKKKGQETGGHAATLVAIIALLILLYILFVPPETRNELLGIENETSSGVGNSEENGVNITLVEEWPGRIDYTDLSEVDHDLPTVTLFSRKEGTLIKEKDSVYVSKALFGESFYELQFDIEDLEDVDNVLLSFVANKRDGRLKINLNGNEIFNREIETLNINPIRLKNDLLKESNILKFEASSPGVAFWSRNEYELSNVKLTADITDTTKLDAKLKFIVDEEEKAHIKKGSIRFFVDCDRKQGKLFVNLNDNNLYSAVPDCQDYVKVEYLPYALKEGENELEFSVTEGAYLIDRIITTSSLKKPREFIYDFKLNESFYRDIRRGDHNIYLRMNFIDKEYKEADLMINGQLTHMSTEELEYERDLRSFIREGMNAIKITPKASMYVQDLKVVAIEVE